MKKLKVALLAGGPSAEHDVSLKSSQQILLALDTTKYEVIPVKISKTNTWGFGTRDFSVVPELSLLEGLQEIQNRKVDIVFLGLHGSFGEDGKLQGFLETLGIPFTGSGSFASAMAMDKIVSQDLLAGHNFNVIKTVDFWQLDWELDRKQILDLVAELGQTIIVKPVGSGSSIGVCKNNKRSSLAADIESTFEHGKHIMVQPCLSGREFSCGVLEQAGKLTVLPATEIIPKNAEFFDYDAKYQLGGSTEVTPASVELDLMAQMQESAAKAHIALGCKGYSRTDFLLQENTLYTLELNTLPGMTSTSLLPQQADAVGISFTQLLDTIIKAGLG